MLVRGDDNGESPVTFPPSKSPEIFRSFPLRFPLSCLPSFLPPTLTPLLLQKMRRPEVTLRGSRDIKIQELTLRGSRDK